MTISDSRQLLLRHEAGKRSRSTLARGSRSDSAYKHRHLLENSRSVLKLGQDFGTMVASEPANGKSRFSLLVLFLTIPSGWTQGVLKQLREHRSPQATLNRSTQYPLSATCAVSRNFWTDAADLDLQVVVFTQANDRCKVEGGGL